MFQSDVNTLKELIEDCTFGFNFDNFSLNLVLS
jgi:hypothetical protein